MFFSLLPVSCPHPLIFPPSVCFPPAAFFCHFIVFSLQGGYIWFSARDWCRNNTSLIPFVWEMLFFKEAGGATWGQSVYMSTQSRGDDWSCQMSAVYLMELVDQRFRYSRLSARRLQHAPQHQWNLFFSVFCSRQLWVKPSFRLMYASLWCTGGILAWSAANSTTKCI